MQKVVNFVLFQVGWFACVLSAARQMPWLGVFVVLAIVAWHLSQAKRAKPEVFLLLAVLFIGGIYDQTMIQNGLLTYQSPGWDNLYSGSNLVPIWILALWAEFVTILNVSLRWMHGKWIVAILFGAIGGPLAYLGAAKLGAVTINAVPLSYIALSLGWAVITPLLLKLSENLDGFKPVDGFKT